MELQFEELKQDTARARILVVDDEPHVCAAVTRALELMGHCAEAAGSGREALTLLEHSPYDLMVLDLQMPEMDGVEVMRRARQICPDLLVIILTGHGTLDSAIAAVKSQAVDYMLKPASVHDIAAAVAAALQERAGQRQRQHLLHVMSEAVVALRQIEAPVVAAASSETPPERFLRAGALTFDRQKRLAVVAGVAPRTAELTQGEASMLAGLMEHPDQALTCRHLVRVAWGYDLDEYEAQSLVRPCVFRLRRKIEADPDKPQLIRTVRARGYLLASTTPRS